MFKVTKKAFTALLVGSIMAIMLGAVLLIISYTVIAAVMGTINTTAVGPMGVTVLNGGTPGALNTSYQSAQSNIVQALNVIGIGLIVAGIAGIIYMLIGLGGTGTSRM
jgi:hypothetical protein